MSDSSQVRCASVISLSQILPNPIPTSLTSPLSLLDDTCVAADITLLLCRPNSGVGDDPLCHWFYDTFQTSDPSLHLVVLSFLPALADAYLSRVALRKPLAGFEAVLLAIYAHETTSRSGQALTVNIPDLFNPSIYHDNSNTNSNAAELNVAVVSPSLVPHGTIRSTQRARIVGVTLEMYYEKIAKMPDRSKIDFCKMCESWAGQDGEMYGEQGSEERNVWNGERRIGLSWELLQPMMRILGHCVLGASEEVRRASGKACRSLYVRALHDVNAKAILATQSLIRLGKMATTDSESGLDPTEIPIINVINL